MTGRQRMAIEWTVLGIIWLLFFAGLEGYALMQSDPNGGLTLSRYTYQISVAWRPIIFLLGFTVGVLAEHFWRYVSSELEYVASDVPAWLRWSALAFAWLLVVLLTPGGAAIFLLGIPIGQLVTRFWWPWNPKDTNDHRG